jgi:hypothetical protein
MPSLPNTVFTSKNDYYTLYVTEHEKKLSVNVSDASHDGYDHSVDLDAEQTAQLIMNMLLSMAPFPLRGVKPIVLYFGSVQQRDDTLKAIGEAVPNVTRA